jgi:D-alanyl-D-alanine carboxypeptidase/D-alanyl-D-alanine-endopeptidase (penicillin-binding protein 4)
MIRVAFKAVSFLGLCLLATALHADPGGQSSLEEQLSKALDDHSTARRTTVTLKVIDVESGEVLFDRGGDRLLTPASNLKIYTSACALDLFGPERQFETTVRAEGELQDGVLQGDLVIVGGGDSMLSSKDLGKLADRVVREWDLEAIHGKVVVDNSRYSQPVKGPGWMWDDDPDYYNMSVTPLMVDFNVLDLRIAPGKEGTIKANLVLPSSYPELEIVPADSLAKGVLATRRPFTHPIVIADSGKLEKAEKVRITMLDPGAWVAGVFSEMLSKRGVEFSEDVAVTPPSNEEAHTIVHKGQSLAKTLKHFNDASENAVGEVLLHEIAISHGIKRPNWPDGAKLITDWLIEKAGLEKDSFRLVDGSGLSRYNLISADSSVKLLRFMDSHPHGKVFFAALPTYEVEINGKKKPVVSAKSGGMGAVSTISGYVKTTKGQLLAFSLLANGYIGSAEPVFGLRQDVWEVLAHYGGKN